MIVVPWPMVFIVAPLTNSVLTIGPSVIKIFNKFFLFLHLCFKNASGHLYNPVLWHKTRSNGVVNPGKFRNTRLVHTFCCPVQCQVQNQVNPVYSPVQSPVQSSSSFVPNEGITSLVPRLLHRWRSLGTRLGITCLY